MLALVWPLMVTPVRQLVDDLGHGPQQDAGAVVRRGLALLKQRVAFLVDQLDTQVHGCLVDPKILGQFGELRQVL